VAHRAIAPVDELERTAAILARRRWGRRVKVSDPRLGRELHALAPKAGNAREAGEYLQRYRGAGANRQAKARRAKALVKKGDALRRLGVVAEFESISKAVTGSERAGEALKLRLGLDGHLPRTLEEVAVTMGVTRERVRQFERRFTDRIENREVWTPALSRALRQIKLALPISGKEAVGLLRHEGLIGEGEMISPRSLLRLGGVFHEKAPFEEIDGWLLPAGASRQLASVGVLARKLSSRWGALTVSELAGVLQDHGEEKLPDAQIRTLLELTEGARWLGPEKEWLFISTTARNRLRNQIEKILSVAGSIEIGELRDGVGRHHRMEGFRPPREVLARLCEEFGYVRDDNRIAGGVGLADWHEVLGANEAALVEILFEHGPVMRRDELEELAVVEGGMNRNSFYIYLTYSPVLARYAPGVYGLRGAEVGAAKVKAMIPPRVRTQVLQDHGWTKEGEIWIAYKISSAGAGTGVLSVPTALSDLLEGTYSLRSEDGQAIGKITVAENLWSLSGYFRRRGIEAGDHLVLRFDTRERLAKAFAGGPDLLLRFQEGE
jgi:hypothetical protein